MKKLADYGKNHLGNIKKRRISLNLLSSYLLILLAPVAAIIFIYLTAENALVNTEKERMQSVLSQVGNNFDREVDQAQKAGYYVGCERRLCNYLLQGRKENKADEFYSLYTIASGYPNYTLTNQVIKDIFVLILDSQFILKIPQVIPQTERGAATLEGFPFHSYDQFLEFSDNQDPNQTLFYYEDAKGSGNLFLSCQEAYPYALPGRSAVVVQLDLNQVRQMLRPILAGREGLVALVDENNQILECAENQHRGGALPDIEKTDLDKCLKDSRWSTQNLVICTETLAYNGWKVICAVPRSVLTEQIGVIRYAIVICCAVSILIGVIICLAYWFKRKSMVQEFFNLQERMELDERKNGKEEVWFWRSFKRFLGDVNKLQSQVEQQESLIREDFIRKLLYGTYDSAEQLLEAAEQAKVSVGESNYYVVDVEFEDPFKAGLDCSKEEFTLLLGEFFEKYLPWKFWRYQVSELTVVLLIHSDEEIPEKLLKEALEKMNYEFYSRFKVQSYMGISNEVGEPLEIARQYEIASRISEFARYRGIRVPVLPRELPREQMADQPLFFTIDMELKLVTQIRKGSDEQLEAMISQIKNVYFHPGNSHYTYRHTIEILRGCLFRSIPMEDESEEARTLRGRIQKACCEEQIFQLLRETRQFCAYLNREHEESSADLDRDKISSYIEEQLGNSCLNLCMLAEWLEEPERKLYNDFKLCFGVSFSTYLEQRRITRACELLKGGMAVKDTAEKVGYGSDYSFRRAFKRVVGIPPSDFRKMETV